MDTYLLIYLCIVLIYGTYLCATTDNMQIPTEVNDDALKTRLRGGINDTIMPEKKNKDKQNQQEQKRKTYTDDDFICDCNNVYKEQHELEREIIQDMMNKHYLRSGKQILTYSYTEGQGEVDDKEEHVKEDEDKEEDKIIEENNKRVCNCEGNKKNKTPHEWILVIPPSNVMLERDNVTHHNRIDEISRSHLQYALASMFEAR